MRWYLWLALAFVALPSAAAEEEPSTDPWAKFPAAGPPAMYETVNGFRSEVERRVHAIRRYQTNADTVLALVDTLVAAWDRYGDFLDRDYGDSLNASRGRPYWFIATDNAADTLTDRVGWVIDEFIRSHPEEKLGPARAAWELGASQLGVTKNKLFGFQFVELARRASLLRKELEPRLPNEKATLQDANVRFLWDLVQFYRQLHANWFDRQSMRIAQEDWVINRTVGRCKDPKWKLAVSLTAVSIDTAHVDPMTDKFMHRLVFFDAACAETVDFIYPLPHYRLVERELDAKTPAQKDSLLQRYRIDAERRGARERAPERGGGKN